MGSRLLLGLFATVAVGAVIWVAISGGGPVDPTEGPAGPAPRPDDVLVPPPLVPADPGSDTPDETGKPTPAPSGTGTLLVTVLDPENRAMAGCVVTAAGQTETTGADGLARFEDFPAGKRIMVEAEGPNAQDVRTGRRILLKKGQEMKTVFVIHAGGAFRGVVRGPGGAVLTTPFEIRIDPTAVTGSFYGRLNQIRTSKSFPAGDGSFTYPRVRPGGYVATAIAEGFVDGASKPFRVEMGETTEGIEITLSAGGSVAGVVVDAESGVPVAGVRVGLALGRRGVFISSVTGYVRQGTKTATTDAQGAFRIRDLSPGTYHVTASKKGRPVATLEGIEVTAGAETGGLRLAIGNGGTITGTVYGPDGAPLPKQSVLVQPVMENFDFEGDYGRRVQTDESGVYRAEGLDPGRYRIKLPASANVGAISIAFSGTDMNGEKEEKPKEPLGPDMVDVAEGQVVTKDLRADPRATIRGVVTSTDGKPLREMVRLKRVEEKKTERPRFEIPRMTHSDAKGAYSLDGLEAGRWRVSCGDASETVEVGSGETIDVPFVLSPARVEGIVIDRAGKPVAGVQVRATRKRNPEDGPFSGGRVSSVRTGKDGRFTIPKVFAGTWTFRASKDGVEGRTEEIEVSRGGLVRDVRIELIALTELRVRVVDAEGNPKAGIRISAAAAKARDSKQGTTNAAGVAVLQVQGGDTYNVFAWATGTPAEAHPVVVESGVPAGIEIVLK